MLSRNREGKKKIHIKTSLSHYLSLRTRFPACTTRFSGKGDGIDPQSQFYSITHL